MRIRIQGVKIGQKEKTLQSESQEITYISSPKNKYSTRKDPDCEKKGLNVNPDCGSKGLKP